MPLSLRFFLFAAALAGPVQAATTTPATPASAPIVAQVGNEKITLSDFEQAFRLRVARLISEQGIPYRPEVLNDFADLRPKFLPLYVRDRAVQQLARAQVNPTSIDAQAEINKLRAEFKDEGEFMQALQDNGYQSEEEYREAYIRQQMVVRYLEQLQKRFESSVRDSVITNYYNLNRKDFIQPASACVRHILLKTKAEAEKVMAELKAGKDFKTLAAQSIDTGSAAHGGSIGCIQPEDTVAAFDEASFTGPLGTPQLAQTEYGWHVLIVDKRTDARIQPLEQVSAEIRGQLLRDSAQKYLDQQIARIKVETFPEVLGAPTQTAPTPTTPSTP